MGYYTAENLAIAAARWRRGGARGVLELARAYVEIQRRADVVSQTPSFAQIEPTSQCNLKCPACAHSRYRGDADLTVARFRQLLQQLPNLERVTLQGMGEPLMNEHTPDLVAEATARSIRTHLYLNGTLLRDSLAGRLAEAAPAVVFISIDAATPELFARLRPPASLPQVCENVQRFMLRARRGRPTPVLAVCFTGTTRNIHELPRVVELAAELGAARVLAQDAHSWGDERIARRVDAAVLRRHPEQVSRWLERAGARARQVGVALYFAESSGTALRCSWPWQSTYITSGGQVTPCCLQGYDPRVVCFGNAFEETFAEIWNRPGYREFRRTLAGREPPAICRGCNGYSQRTRRID